MTFHRARRFGRMFSLDLRILNSQFSILNFPYRLAD